MRSDYAEQVQKAIGIVSFPTSSQPGFIDWKKVKEFHTLIAYTSRCKFGEIYREIF